MASAASHGLAGHRTTMWVDTAFEEHAVRGVVKAIRTDRPTRVLMVVAGGSHDSNIIAAVKAKAKDLVTWPSGSVRPSPGLSRSKGAHPYLRPSASNQ